MSEQLRLRGDVAANVASYTGPSRETVVDTTNNRLVVQDGVTPGGWAAAKLSEVSKVSRSTASASYSALATDRLIAITSIVSPIYITLPSAAAFQAGARLLVIDESGAPSLSKAIALVPAGADIIVGALSNVISFPYGFVEVESNGVGQWTVSDAASGGAPGAASPFGSPPVPLNSAFSGQATIGVSQPVFTAVIAEPRFKSGMRPVVSVISPLVASNGIIALVNVVGYAPGQISILGVLLTLDGKTAPSQKARLLLTLSYIGA
jgi:hypothetical protein